MGACASIACGKQKVYLSPEQTIDKKRNSITQHNQQLVEEFTKLAQKDTSWMGEQAGFEPLTIYGGQWFELVGNPAQLYENLMQIIDDNACE